MHPSDLANRFSNYADAVVAFAVLNSVGFLTAMGEENIREEIDDVSSLGFLVAVIVAASFYTILAMVFRHAELQLREEAQEVSSARVERYQRYFQLARITVIWVSAGLTMVVHF